MNALWYRSGLRRSVAGTVGIGLMLLAVTLAGCQAEPPAMPVLPPPAVTVTQPVAHPVQTYYEYNGTLEAVEMVEITARVMGFLNKISFTEGQEVQQGEMLFEIDPREYAAAVKKAEADRRKALAELRHAQLEEERGKKLLENSALSEEDVQKRIATRETAEAMVMQAEASVEAAQLQLNYTEIRAPITGQISRTQVTRGNLVGQNGNTLLTTILSMDPLYVYFDAPERDLIEYQRSLDAAQNGDFQGGLLPLEIGVATEKGYPHPGEIDFRENRVDVGTGTIRVRGRIPNPRDRQSGVRLLYPGLYARVRVPKGEPRSLQAIPEDALMTGQEGRYVYVLDDENMVQKRTVTVGPIVWKIAPSGEPQPSDWTLSRSPSRPPAAAEPAPATAPGAAGSAAAGNAAAGGPVETPQVYSVISIESGLDAGDRVVINGLTKARPGAPVAPEMWTLQPPAETAEDPRTSTNGPGTAESPAANN